MTTKLQELRETWRPKLAHDARWMVMVGMPAALIAIIARPDAGVAIVSLAGLMLGYAASLFGLRQWGKNAGVE